MSRIKDISDENLDKMPNKSPMRVREFDRYDDYWVDHWGKQRRIYAFLDRFMEAHVGHGINNTYKQLLNKVKADKDLAEIIGGFSIREAFHSYFDSNYYPKYLNVNGIIKKNPDYWSRRIHRPEIRVSDDKPSYYIWNGKYDEKYPELRDIIYGYFGRKVGHHILEEPITPMQYKKYCGSGIDWRFIDRGFKTNRLIKLTLNDCFDCYGEGGEVVKKGENGYDRVKAELNDARKKARRELKEEKRKKVETMLHDIVEKAREEERRKNIIDRDRLGFDNNSFIGEPYHGQKRKKKEENNGA